MWKFLVPVILAVVFVVVEEVVTSREEASSCSYSTTKKAQDYSHKSLIFCWTWKVCVWENSQSVRKWALINQPWQSQPPGNGCSSINSNGGGLDACPLATLQKFHDFAITQILHEINFEDSRSAKSVILTYCMYLYFDSFTFCRLKSTKIKNSEPLK